MWRRGWSPCPHPLADTYTVTHTFWASSRVPTLYSPSPCRRAATCCLYCYCCWSYLLLFLSFERCTCTVFSCRFWSIVVHSALFQYPYVYFDKIERVNGPDSKGHVRPLWTPYKRPRAWNARARLGVHRQHRRQPFRPIAGRGRLVKHEDAQLGIHVHAISSLLSMFVFQIIVRVSERCLARSSQECHTSLPWES